ncbi:MAG: LON peptidase substrate-binding domain-containing protein [Gammaproteobacteria bacterium]|nr:LON peptidase substrate-binding domain-containing protein [Gammaproteobacteria bacterium]
MLPLALFPLNSVLFPDGRLRLKVFEARYIDMVSHCLKNDQPFGICLIDEGNETGSAAVPCRVGTLAHIVDWEMAQQGVFTLTVSGGRRFDVVDYEVNSNQAVLARVRLREEMPREKLAPEFELSKRVLGQLLIKEGDPYYLEHQRSNDADWVANRLAELLPMDNLDRQALLEQDDPELRLQVIQDALTEHGWHQ